MESIEKLEFEDNEIEDAEDFDPASLYDESFKAIKFELDNPIKIGKSEVITTIKVRKPRFGDLDDLVISSTGSIPMGQIRQIAKKLTGLDDLRISKIEDEDIKKVTLSVIYFLGRAFRSKI